MKIGNKGIELIKSFEGLFLTAYKCPASIWTIGYGHTKGVKQGQQITANKAEEFLREDVAQFEKDVLKQNLKLTQNQFDAFVSFVFNVGGGNFQKSTLLRTAKVNSNDPSIKDEFLRWNKAAGKVLPGLTRRRQAEANLYFEK